jgi:hypothetical protein
MSTALGIINKHRNVLFIDAALLLGLYLLPSFSHLTSLPLYKLEPMRVALIIALLFTHRANAYLIALTIPLASVWITGHPPPLKAVLMGIEFAVLVAAYSQLVRKDRIPAFVALTAGILLGKAVYYSLKLVALNAGWLGGSLVSTPVQTQIILAVGTAAFFAVVEHRWGRSQAPK